MKKKNIILIIFLICILLITACQKTNNTPLLASMSMKANMEHLNYEEFRDAYAQGEESWISEEQFVEVKSLLTSGSSHKTYELFKFDNGEMILVEFATTPQNGEYKVQGIEVVPDEMKELFK
ncbi:MAG: hypothetical protein GX947_08485 [Tissierellia bacterium]|nr:hypothetical protein [Tissierellia bacterium]